MKVAEFIELQQHEILAENRFVVIEPRCQSDAGETTVEPKNHDEVLLSEAEIRRVSCQAIQKRSSPRCHFTHVRGATLWRYVVLLKRFFRGMQGRLKLASVGPWAAANGMNWFVGEYSDLWGTS